MMIPPLKKKCYLEILTGKNNLWAAQGLNNFFHSNGLSDGKVRDNTLNVNPLFKKAFHSPNYIQILITS